MTRTYPIPTTEIPLAVSRTVEGVLEPFGFHSVTANEDERTLTVNARPEVFEVCEGSILFILGIRRWKL